MESKTVAGEGTYLTFRLHDQTFGVEIPRVREIVEIEGEITRVPRTPVFMRGVMNLRGNVVPVVDMNAKLGFEPSSVTEDTCVVIVEVTFEDEALILGAMVDGVEEVVELSPEEILDPPPSGTPLRPEFLTGLARKDEGFVMLMSVDDVLAVTELAQAAGAAREAPVPA